MGIIGKPQSGKTTVFNAAAGRQEAVGDFSQAAHRAVIKVPDERVDRLGEIIRPGKVTHAEIEFLDSPGFTGKGSESTGFEVSADLRQSDALLLVIDAFSVDARPRGEIRNLLDEMILADQVLVEGVIDRKTKRIKLTGDKSEMRELSLLESAREHLDNQKPLIDLELGSEDDRMLRGYQLLTRKPVLIVVNIAEDKLPNAGAVHDEMRDLIAPGKSDVAVLCGSIQMELAQMDQEEQQEFLNGLDIKTSAMERVIRKSYKLLGLISFITISDKEVRARPIRKGTVAVKAAGAVHSDMERGFIRAETTRYEDYVEYRTAAALKAAGKTRLEGKDYVVQDGDVILFRFNV